MVMARDRDHFAISDLSPYYFGEYEGEDEEGEGNNGDGVTGYIYTDRPVYRPAQKVYFRAYSGAAGEAWLRDVKRQRRRHRRRPERRKGPG